MEWETVRFRLGGFGASGENLGLSLFNLKKLQENQDLISWRETHRAVGGRVVMGLIDRCSCV